MNAETLLFHMLKGGVGKRCRDEMGASIARSLHRNVPLYFGGEDERTLENLKQTGFSHLPPVFTAEQIASIHAYFSDKPAIYFNDAPHIEPSRVHAGHRFNEWPQDIVSACPEFAAAAHDPRLLRIAEAYLEAPPLVTILTAWWSYPSTAPLGGMQHFHHDRDDFRCLKLFVYLTDVTEETGPHQYVNRTHETAALGGRDEMFWRWMDGSHRKRAYDVTETFGTDVKTILGEAGSTFLEDTRGLHRGVPPVTGPRLAFEICYAMRPKSNGVYWPIPWETNHEAARLFYERRA